MSATERPSLLGATWVVARFQSMRLLRSKKLVLAIVAALIVTGTAIAGRYASEVATGDGAFRVASLVGLFGFLSYLIPFLFNAGSIAEEVEGRTFTFLTARPLGPTALTAGKLLSGAGFSVGVLAAAVLLLHVGVSITEPDALLEGLSSMARVMGAASLLAIYYSAICTFWGALVPQAAGIVSVLHLATLEFLFGTLPFPFSLLSMNFHARSLAGVSEGGEEAVRAIEWLPWLSIGLLLSFTLIVAIFCAITVRTREYRYARS